MSDKTINETNAVALVTEMMAIPGRSGEEREIAAFIRQKLLQAGVAERDIQTDNVPAKSPLGGNCGNLIVRIPGSSRAPRRLLMAHMDTVPLCVGAKPVRRGPFIESQSPDTGLGGDNRAGAAVVLNSALEVLNSNLPHPPLTLFWTVQEEVGLFGVRYAGLSRLGKPKLCFNWDGSVPHVTTIGATGAWNMDITVRGIPSHAGAHPEQGASAASIASIAIADLTSNGWHGAVRKGRKSGTSNIGVIGGGSATNVVMPEVQLKAEARSHDPAFRDRIVNEFRKAFDRAVRAVKNESGETGAVEFDQQLRYDSFRLASHEPCVAVAADAIRSVGLEPESRISNGGLDANWMFARGLPTVSLGCGQQAIHTVDESLHVPGFLLACRIGLAIATGAV